MRNITPRYPVLYVSKAARLKWKGQRSAFRVWKTHPWKRGGRAFPRPFLLSAATSTGQEEDTRCTCGSSPLKLDVRDRTRALKGEKNNKHSGVSGERRLPETPGTTLEAQKHRRGKKRAAVEEESKNLCSGNTGTAPSRGGGEDGGALHRLQTVN